MLIQADLGVAVSERIIKAVSAGRYDKEIEPEEVKRILAAEVAKVLKPVEVPFNFGSEKPFVILVVGVNGAGKTTTIGKLGAIATGEGFKVMFAACDTFRAAAIEQLTIWGERIGAKTLSRPTGSDSSGLAYDAMQTAAKTARISCSSIRPGACRTRPISWTNSTRSCGWSRSRMKPRPMRCCWCWMPRRGRMPFRRPKSSPRWRGSPALS